MWVDADSRALGEAFSLGNGLGGQRGEGISIPGHFQASRQRHSWPELIKVANCFGQVGLEIY